MSSQNLPDRSEGSTAATTESTPFELRYKAVDEPLAILRQIDAIGNDSRLIDGLGTCSREDQKDLPVSMMAPTIRLSRAFVAPF
jgi:hypothetical protein